MAGKSEKMQELDKIAAVIAWQKCDDVHPLTCGMNSRHHLLYPTLDASGIAYLQCPDCAYTQGTIPSAVLSLVESGERVLAVSQSPVAWQKCPVCDGTGLVSRPPWIAGDQREWVSSSTGPYPCKACNGTRMVIAAYAPALSVAVEQEPVAWDHAFFTAFTSRPCDRCGGKRNWAVDGQLQAVCFKCSMPASPASVPESEDGKRLDWLWGEVTELVSWLGDMEYPQEWIPRMSIHDIPREFIDDAMRRAAIDAAMQSPTTQGGEHNG